VRPDRVRAPRISDRLGSDCPVPAPAPLLRLGSACSGPVLARLASMQLAIEVLVLLHLIGFAAIFGGLIVQARCTQPEVNAAMVCGALTQLLTGIALFVVGQVGGEPVNWVPISIKTLITLFLVLITFRNRRFLSIPRGLWALLTGLTLVNAAVGVLWA
jgi:hypothetical protein